MISIIIVNYNQEEYVKHCVNSIYDNFRSYPFEVIIINNSPEQDLNYLINEFPDLTVIANDNKGFSQANNLGAKHSSGEFLFFLNADTVIQSDFLRQFYEHFSNRNFGAAGMKLYHEDGSFQLSFWKENTFFNEMNNKNEEEKFKKKDLKFIKSKEVQYSKLSKVEWVSAAAMIIKKDIFLSVGGFDENFFLFYEDADLCKRLKERNMDIWFFPYSDIVHFKGENVNKRFYSETYFYSKQSQLLYYKKHNGFLDNLLIKIYLFVKFLILYFFTLKSIYLKILILVFK